MQCDHDAKPPICYGHEYKIKPSRRVIRDNFVHDNFPELNHDQHHVLHSFITWFDMQSIDRREAMRQIVARGSYLDETVNKWKAWGE